MNYTTWIELNRAALEHNIMQYKRWLPEKTSIAPVIKANAYGHGLAQIGLLHDMNPHVSRLCVASSSEGVALRQAGVQKPILVLGFINSGIQSVIENDLDMIVSDVATIQALNSAAQAVKKVINVHLKIDTGLSRLGIFPEQVSYFKSLIAQCNNLKLQGICSHLIESCNKESTNEQENIFKEFFDRSLQIHIANSHGSLHAQFVYDFVRIGAGLYGYLPEADPILQSKLYPVLSLKTRVIGIKNIVAGATVGYARTYTASRPTKLAILGMGYFEGINPDLANTGQVLIHGRFAPIVGRIMMNYFTVDVTDIPNVQMHDVATVLGRDGSYFISAYDWRIGSRKNVRICLAQLNPLIPKIVVQQPIDQWLQQSLSESQVNL